MTAPNDLMGDDFGEASPPTPDELSREYERLKRREQEELGYYEEACQSSSSRMVTPSGKTVRFVEEGDDHPPFDNTPADYLKQRLIVNIEKLIATLDGKTHEIPGEVSARWLKVFAAYPGRWISSSQLKDYDTELDGARSDKIRKRLPLPLQQLFEAEKGKGVRLNLPQ